MFTTDNPQAAAAHLQSLIGTGERFTASIIGPHGSGKTSALAAMFAAAFDAGIGQHEMAAYATSWAAIGRLRAMASIWPSDLTGTPGDAMRRHTALPCAGRLGIDDVARGYLALLARVNELGDGPADLAFLAAIRPKVRAAIRADIRSRLTGEPLPRSAYLAEVADYLAAFKQHYHLADDADLIHADYYASPQIKLVLLDEIGAQDRALLVRYFPNASLITADRQSVAADHVIALPRCLRTPERVDITGTSPSLVPPPVDFASLIIFTPRWRRGAWLEWCRDHAIARPEARIMSPRGLQHVEAEIVIVDCAGGGWDDVDAAELALTRATKRLIVLQGEIARLQLPQRDARTPS
jgi:hypothetical protein